MMPHTRIIVIASMAAGLGACGRLSSPPIPAPRLWYLASPVLENDSSEAGGLVFLDSATFRPVLASRGRGVATFTSYQGTRYHPDAVRAIAEEPAVLDSFSRTAAASAASAGDGLLLDFQGLSPSDLPGFVELVRALGTAARARSLSPFGIIVPAADTLSYPAQVLARVADVIVVRLGTEHRPGTAPGPLATPDFIRRQLGSRATGLGATRIAAEFPLYGYIWNRVGSARIITFREANELILSEGSSFRRDPSSQFLTADGRDGWTIWLPDARTIQSLITAAQSRGVNVIALTGIPGSDPAIAGSIVTR
jgi:hypothetical protein